MSELNKLTSNISTAEDPVEYNLVGINQVHAVPGDDGLAIHWNTSQGAEKLIAVQPHESLEAACSYLRARGFQLHEPTYIRRVNYIAELM